MRKWYPVNVTSAKERPINPPRLALTSTDLCAAGTTAVGMSAAGITPPVSGSLAAAVSCAS